METELTGRRERNTENHGDEAAAIPQRAFLKGPKSRVSLILAGAGVSEQIRIQKNACLTWHI